MVPTYLHLMYDINYMITLDASFYIGNDVWTYTYNYWNSRKLTGPFELYSASAESYQGKKNWILLHIRLPIEYTYIKIHSYFFAKTAFFIFRVAIEAKQY